VGRSSETSESLLIIENEGRRILESPSKIRDISARQQSNARERSDDPVRH